MKSKLLATLLLGAALVAAASLVANAATETLKSDGGISSYVVTQTTNVAENITLDTNLSQGYQLVSAVFAYNTSVTSTGTVAIVRGSITNVVGNTGSFTGTTKVLDMNDPEIYIHPGEVLQINPGVTNSSVTTVHMVPIK